VSTAHVEPTTAAEEAVHALFFTGEGRRNPYPLYHRLREVAPVHRSDLLGGTWLMSRYEDCHTIARNPAFEKALPAPHRSSGSCSASPEPTWPASRPRCWR
jgi:cytochrome P450